MPKKKEEFEEEEVETEDLEKALDTALEELEKSHLPEVDEDEDEDEEEEESKKRFPKKVKKSREVEEPEIEEPDFESLSKSLSESIEEEEDASDVLDGIPFVKAMIDSLDDQISEMIKAIVFLSDKIDEVGEKLEKSGKVGVAQAMLVKSISQTVRQIGETPQPLKSFLGKNIKILRKSESGEETRVDMSKADALEKLTELHKAGKVELKDVINYESRIQRGVELPQPIMKLLSEKAS